MGKGNQRNRRYSRYIPYDYERAYREKLEAIEEEEEIRKLVSGKVRHIYATKEIRSGDQLEIEIYPEFRKGEENQIPDDARKRKNREAQKNLNDKNSRKYCERLIQENFGDGDFWITFTYSNENVPETMEEALRNMQAYIRRVNYRRRKLGLETARYIYVTECSAKGRWHHHLVMDGDLSMDEVEKAWKKGRRNQVRRIEKDEDGLVGMARYITKDKERAGKYQKAWCASKGLRKPEERVNHYKTKQNHVNRMVTGDLNICDHLLKWYGDEYDFREAEIRKNEFNGCFYIYGRLRLKC